MTELGDREIGGLLSALAEAQDFPAAASFLLGRLVDLSGASSACFYRLDPSLESLTLAAKLGLDSEPLNQSVPIKELSSPLVLCAVANAPVRGRGPFHSIAFTDSWIALPMPRSGFRGAPEVLPRS